MKGQKLKLMWNYDIIILYITIIELQQSFGTLQNEIIGEKEIRNQVPNDKDSQSNENEITEDQRARMEANKLRALEKAAARARSQQVTVPSI